MSISVFLIVFYLSYWFFYLCNDLLRKRCLYSEFSGPHFASFGLNIKIYRVNLTCSIRVREIWTRKTPKTDTFLHSDLFTYRIIFSSLHYNAVIYCNNIIADNCQEDITYLFESISEWKREWKPPLSTAMFVTIAMMSIVVMELIGSFY